MQLARILAGVGVMALAACTPAAEGPAPAAEPVAVAVETPFGPGPEQTDGEAFDATVSGAATWSGIEVPETARLIIEVRDVTRTDESATMVLKEEFPVAGGPPAAFSGTVSKFDLIPGGNLVLRARVQDGYAILLASDGDIDIADSGETAGLDVPLFNPEDLARGTPRKMITPEGTAYTCGGEALTIALEAGAAYVIFADGTAVKLDKLSEVVGGAAQFSNGRFVVEQSGSGILFGRGRAMPMACIAVD